MFNLYYTFTNLAGPKKKLRIRIKLINSNSLFKVSHKLFNLLPELIQFHYINLYPTRNSRRVMGCGWKRFFFQGLKQLYFFMFHVLKITMIHSRSNEKQYFIEIFVIEPTFLCQAKKIGLYFGWRSLIKVFNLYIKRNNLKFPLFSSLNKVLIICHC